MSFSSVLTIDGFAQSYIDDASKRAIIDATASSMGVSYSDIAMTDFSFTAAALQRQRMRRLVGYVLAVTLRTSVSMAGYPQYSSPAELHTALKSSLTSSVSSGSYNTLLATAASTYGSTSLSGATCSGVEVSDAIITSAEAASEGDASSPFMAATIALGAVLAAVTVALAAFALYARWRKARGKVAVAIDVVSDPKQEVVVGERAMSEPASDKRDDEDSDDEDFFSQAFFDKLIAESNDFFRVKPTEEQLSHEIYAYSDSQPRSPPHLAAGEQSRADLARSGSRRLPQESRGDEEEGGDDESTMRSVRRVSGFGSHVAGSQRQVSDALVLGAAASPLRRLAPMHSQTDLHAGALARANSSATLRPIAVRRMSSKADEEEGGITTRGGLLRPLGSIQAPSSYADLSLTLSPTMLPPGAIESLQPLALPKLEKLRGGKRRRNKGGGAQERAALEKDEPVEPYDYSDA